MTALILSIAILLHRGTPPPAVVTAIASAAATPEEAALLTTFAALESGYQERPAPQSWDARAGRVCGVFQLLCPMSHGAAADAKTWLWLVRRYGLASVTGSAAVASRRLALARAALAGATR